MSNMLEKARKYETEKIAATDPQTKPLFHVSAPTGWINDPNGFSFYDGQIHLFYQYHPYNFQRHLLRMKNMIKPDAFPEVRSKQMVNMYLYIQE